MSSPADAAAPPPEAPAVREKTEAEREYERKLDRDLRILRVAFPIMAVVYAVVVIVTGIAIVSKL